MKKLIFAAAAAVMLVSCGGANKIPDPTRGEVYSKFYEEQPKVLLVMPPINNSSNVEAKDLLYTSISRPLAEAGYYVISPVLAMDILKAESAYDSENFIKSKLDKFRDFFACDAVVFSEINTWTKIGFSIETDLHYVIRSAKTGETLFDRTCHLNLDLSVDTGSRNSSSALWALIDLTASAITTAATDHIVAARSANYFIFKDIPRGFYHPDFGKDMDVKASPAEISASI